MKRKYQNKNGNKYFSPFTPTLIENKDSKRTNIIPIKSTPVAIWLYYSVFLTTDDYIHMLLTSKYCRKIAELWMVKLYKIKLKEYGLEFKSKAEPSEEEIKNYKELIQKLPALYYTLVDKSYASVYEAIESKNFLEAKRILTNKLYDLNVMKKNIFDMIFIQKDANGQSIAIKARNINTVESQCFLDFCFPTLILNDPLLNSNGIIRIGVWENVLSQLDSKHGMSLEALWMYACAFVCNQKLHCNDMESKNFNKKWVLSFENREISGSERPGVSLSMIATLLGCVDLLKCVLEDIDDGADWDDQMDTWLERDFLKRDFYYSELDYPMLLLDLAAMSKNLELINYVASITERSTSELAAFYIEQKKMPELESCIKDVYMHDKKAFTYPVKLKSLYFNVKKPAPVFFSHVGIAVAQNWPEAVKLLVRYRAEINSRTVSSGYITTPPLDIAINLGYYDMAVLLLELGANPNATKNSLACAISKGEFKFVQLLLKYNVSLNRKFPDENKHYIYPLVMAVYSGYLEIAFSIIEVIGVRKALNELRFEYAYVKRQKEASPSANSYKIKMLEQVSNSLLEKNPSLRDNYNFNQIVPK